MLHLHRVRSSIFMDRDQMADEMEGDHYFCSLDCMSLHHDIPLHIYTTQKIDKDQTLFLFAGYPVNLITIILLQICNM